MMTRRQLAKRLMTINTGLTDSDNRPLRLDHFGSFFTHVTPLPANATMLAAADQHNIPLTPSTLKELAKDAKFAVPDLHMPAAATYLDDTAANQDYMFVALNAAYRDDPDTSYGQPWSMFHDLERPTNTYKLAAQLNDPRFAGAYLTDAFKNTIDSDSGHISQAFCLGRKNPAENILTLPLEQLVKLYLQLRGNKADRYQLADSEPAARAQIAANRTKFERCAAIFAAECRTVQPERLVVWGQAAASALRQMATIIDDADVKALIANLVVVTHYATRMNFAKWVETAQPALLAAVENQPVTVRQPG